MSFASDIIITYDDLTMIDDVMAEIFKLTPTETPLFSGLPKEQANGTTHYWQEQTMSTAQDNAQIEGGAFRAPEHQQPFRPSNVCQIFQKTHSVSSSDQWVKKYGIANQFEKQERENMEKIATDIELALLRGSLNVGSETIARRAAGLINFLTANKTTVVSGTKLTESLFNGILQAIWDNGGKPDEIYTNSFLKRVISEFTGGSTMNNDSKSKRVVNTISYYESDFGTQQIFLHRYMPKTANVDSAVLFLKRSQNYVVIGEPVHPLDKTEVAQTVNGMKGVIRGELTFAAKAQLHQGLAQGFDHQFN